MDAQKRTRRVNRDRSEPGQQSVRGAKQMVILMTRTQSDNMWADARPVRAYVDRILAESPELFPDGMAKGYAWPDFDRESRKLAGVHLRQVLLNDGPAYWLRPSFVLSDMMGPVDDVESPLLLASHGVPASLLTRGFGHRDRSWQRLIERLGRHRLVGTTVRDPQRLPEPLVADEHPVKWCGEKGFMATPAGAGCLLGVALSQSASEAALTPADGDFVREARDVRPDDAPPSVNTDGWGGTRHAFLAWFPNIALIRCFLHGLLKLRDRCRQAHERHRRVWDVYRAATATEFRRLMNELQEWSEPPTWTAPVREMRGKLRNQTDDDVVADNHPGGHRTSNLVDRLMNRLRRLMSAGRGLHGHQFHSELRLRGWSWRLNFRPFAPRSGTHRQHHCPAHRLSGKHDHDHGLHNLLVSGSLLGDRQLKHGIR